MRGCTPLRQARAGLARSGLKRNRRGFPLGGPGPAPTTATALLRLFVQVFHDAVVVQQRLLFQNPAGQFRLRLFLHRGKANLYARLNHFYIVHMSHLSKNTDIFNFIGQTTRGPN